ncbi:MAG: hypothetical protein ACXWQO_07740 [Bdellovibrionota bacterium]
MAKSKKNSDQKARKKLELHREPVTRPVLKKEAQPAELDSQLGGELDELADFEMADMDSIREIVMLDPNDIEFRQRHAEIIEMDSAA